MRNIRFIEVVEMPNYTGASIKPAEYIKLSNFTGYDFDENTGEIVYEIYTINRPTTDMGMPLEYHELLKQEKMQLPRNIVDSWGSDDEIVFDYVIETLGLKKRI